MSSQASLAIPVVGQHSPAEATGFPNPSVLPQTAFHAGCAVEYGDGLVSTEDHGGGGENARGSAMGRDHGGSARAIRHGPPSAAIKDVTISAAFKLEASAIVT